MSVIVYDNEKRVLYSNSPDYDNYDPFTMEIRFWQARIVAWISTYNGCLMGVTHVERPAFAAIS